MTVASAPRPIDASAWRAYQRSRYTILFFVLLTALVLMPIAASVGLPAVLIKILVGGSLLAAVMPNATQRSRRFLFAAVLLLMAARIASDAGYLPVNSAFVLVLMGLTGLIAAGAAMRFVVMRRVVDSETIYAALSTYLLAGMFFGQIYWALEIIRPGSLVGPDPTSDLTAIYYSFVTLATLGYGDFVPRTDVARGVATFEVIGGQLFLAAMVARLVGAFSVEKGDA